MSVKTAGVGHFTIPTAPAAGTSVISGAANTFTTTYVQLIASTAAALYITGLFVESAAALAGTYEVIQLATGGAGSETIVGQYLVALDTGNTQASNYRPIFPPIPVATATRIACKTANSVTTITTLITLECVAQSNVVNDGIAVGTVTTVTNQLTAAAIATGVWQDAVAGDFTVASSVGKSLYIANIAPGASGGHFISGSNSGTTTFGALTVTGATTLTGNMVCSDGITISAPSTLNRAGFDIAGNGTGAAIKLVAGGTGVGLSVAGGGTSGDGVKVTTTSGHGVNLAPVGTSMHGFFSTGGNGGVSDGVKAVAGTGGVDIRGNITGNITGTLSTVTTLTNLPAITANWLTGTGTDATHVTKMATGTWQDAVAGDFTVASSIGKSLFTGNVVPGGAGGMFIAGTNAATTITTGLTTTFTGNLTGSVGSVTGLTASNLDTTVSSRMATYTQPTGFLAATFPAGTIANQTNITAGTITTVSGNVSGNVVGSVGSVVGAVGSVTGAVGSVTGNVGGNVVGSVASVTGAVGSLTVNNDKTGYALSTAGIQALWDKLTSALTTVGSIGKFLVDKLTTGSATPPDVNITQVNGVVIRGTGKPGSEWGPNT